MTRYDAEENELDIRGLCCALWRGKGWIVACAVVLALVALGYSLVARQVWSATASTERPGINRLGAYYAQQGFINSLSAAGKRDDAPVESVIDSAYNEFVLQLAAWDTRREFWLQSHYYQQRKSNDKQADAVLLDRLISNIQYQQADPGKGLNDSIRLLAENARDAGELLRQYVAFANQRAVTHLNQVLAGNWAAQRVILQAQIERQETAARASYDRRLHSVEQALKIAQAQGSDQPQTSAPPEQLPDPQLFLLGSRLLQSQLENLQASGPSYDLSYDQNRAMLGTLSVAPTLTKTFNCWRYLRTPEDPVKRDSPRQGFLMAMWGVVGALIGAGIALARRRTQPVLNT